MPINSRAKGARFERWVANWLKEEMAIEARRGQQFCGISGSHDIVLNLPVNFECKHVSNFSLYKAMEQAERDSGEKTIPVVVYKTNKKDPVLIVKLSRLKDLVKCLADHLRTECATQKPT